MNTSMSNVPINVIYHDDKILVVQTRAHHAIENSSDHAQDNLYGDFNLGLHVDDDPSKVLAHRCDLLDALNQLLNTNHHTSIEQIHWLNQVHGDALLDVDNSSLSNHAYSADASTSMQAGQALAIMTADCVPIMLYNQQTGRVIGIHAGWQGLANGIIAKSIQQYNDDTCITNQDCVEMKHWQAWIGACISVDNYEVGTEVLDKIVAGTVEHFDFEQAQLTQMISNPHKETGKTWINLPKLAQLQLEQLAITVHTDTVPCSYANDQYYSHRLATHQDRRHTGRMAMIITKV